MKKFYSCKIILSVLALLLSVSVMSGMSAQELAEKKITLKAADMDLSAVLEQVSEKSGFRVFYNSNLVRGLKTNAEFNNESVDRILSAVLGPHNLRYTLENETIVISARPARQQDERRVITGTVTDAKSNPVIGANIVVVGTTTGVTTDQQGRFSLSIPVGGTQIYASYIGMVTQTIDLGSRTTFNIVMEEDVTSVGDVVITGYYSQSQTSYTGAARSYSGEQLLGAGNSNVLKSLSNLDPSFRMMENISAGSNPNVLPDFTIRGQTALNLQEEYETNPNQPLFVLDGFEVDSETVFDLDIFRIQTVTILKDASATAIYGSRASNGVVVITTTAPQPGRLTVRYNIDLSFEAADLSDYNLMNAAEKLAYENAVGMYSYFNNYTQANSNYLKSREKAWSKYSERLGWVMQGVDTYWLNKPLQSLAVGHRHRINIEGGDEKLRYQVNAMYEKTPGVMKGSYRERKNVGTKLIYNYKNLRFANEMTYNVTDAVESPYGSFEAYTLRNPYLPYKDSEGNYLALLEVDNRALSDLYIYNPLYNSTLNTKNDTRANYFTDKFSIVWDVTDGLMITGNLSVRDYDSEYNLFKPAQHTDFSLYTDLDRKGSYKKRSTHTTSYEGSVVASYQRSFDLHILTARAGYNIMETKKKEYTLEAEGFPNQNLDDIGFALQYKKDGSPTSSGYKTRMLGFLANVNYIYNERYMADFSFRYDAQSIFGADRKWAPFWSAGLGWNIHNEDFIDNTTYLNYLKLRGSIGETGSMDYDPSQAIATYKYLSGTNYLYNQGAVMKAFGNSDLGWQKTLSYNVGIDASFFRNRLNLTFDYYNKTTNDMITSISLAPSTGFADYTANLGKVENKGFEVYVRAEVLKIPSRQLTVAVFGQLMRNKNTLLKISNALMAYNDQVNAGLDSNSITDPDGKKYNRPRVNYIEGRSIDGIWVNQSLGVDPATGKEFFLNLADGTYTDTWNSRNNVYGGTKDPKFYGAFGMSVYWKNLLVTANFGYSYGGYYYNQTLVDKVEDADLRYNVDKRVASDRWAQPGDISKYTGVTTTYDSRGPDNSGRATRPTSRFIEKRSYLELKAISASYDIRGPRIESSPISNLRVTFNMEDLFHSSTVRTERGIDYPYARNFSVGAQITF